MHVTVKITYANNVSLSMKHVFLSVLGHIPPDIYPPLKTSYGIMEIKLLIIGKF